MDYSKKSKDKLISEIKGLKKKFNQLKESDSKESSQAVHRIKTKLKKYFKKDKASSDYIDGIEQKIDDRTFELTILNEISNKVAYVLNYEHLFELVMACMYKVLGYDICAALLFDEQSANITFNLPYLESSRFTEEIKKILLETFSAITFKKSSFETINTHFVSSGPEIRFSEKRQFNRLESFLSVPIIINKKVIGGIVVASCKRNAFKQNEARVFHTIVNLTSNAIERLQLVKTVEKTKMATMVESMHQGVIMLDETEKIMVLNPKAKEFLDFREEETVNSKKLKERLKRVGLGNALSECVYKQQVATLEIAVKLRKKHILQCEISPVKNVSKELVGVVLVMTDITKMRELDRMKAEFVSVVSHELRTPLTTIREGVSLLLENALGEITMEQSSFMEMVLKDVDRLRAIVDDLLDVSNLKARRTTLDKELVNIGELVKRCHMAFAKTIEKKGLSFAMDCPGEKVAALADEDKLVQVISNLLVNAMNVTEEGNITVGAVDQGKDIKFYVTDTGKGIGRDDLNKVFDRFFQINRINGPGYRGTGLGLSICKEIVNLHGGNIWVESEIGKGAKFIFTIPKYENAEENIYETIEMNIARAKREKKPFVTIVVKLNNYLKLEKSRWLEKKEKISMDLANALKKKEASNRFTFFDSTDDLVFLMEVDDVLVTNVDELAKYELKKLFLDIVEYSKVDLWYGATLYPDDGTDALSLLQGARKRLHSERLERAQKKIMIVDDNVVVRKTLIELLGVLGYTNVIQESSGDNALIILKDEKVDLLILDITLDTIDGYEVIKRIKENMPFRKLRILVISGYEVDNSLLAQYSGDDIIPVLSKPFDINQLEKNVSYLL